MPRTLAVLALALAACAHATAAPRGRVSLTYLGVAGWTISDGRHTVVVDPYFTRPADPLHGAVSDPAAVAAHAPAHADLVLVGHAHVDHLLDAPAVAQRTGAPLLGGRGTIDAGKAAGLDDAHLLLVKGGEDYELDGFSVRVIPSLHSLTGLAAGDDVETFAFLIRIGGEQILVFDTANFIEREVDGLRPDVAIVATGLRDKIHDYACRLMRATGAPRTVLTTHFDDWRAPAGTPIDADTRADLAAFEREIHACAPATEVIVPEAFAPIER